MIYVDFQLEKFSIFSVENYLKFCFMFNQMHITVKTER